MGFNKGWLVLALVAVIMGVALRVAFQQDVSDTAVVPMAPALDVVAGSADKEFEGRELEGREFEEGESAQKESEREGSALAASVLSGSVSPGSDEALDSAVRSDTAYNPPESVKDASANDDGDQPEESSLLALRELEYLREALPGNRVVPAEKTAAEVDALFAEFEEYQALAERVAKGIATAEEKSRYVEIRTAKYEEEMALIYLCNDVAASADAAPLCANMAAGSERRLADIQKSLQALQQDW